MKKFVVAVVLGSLLFSSPSFSKEKEPVLAGVLSGLSPGLGQVYNGQVLKGQYTFWGSLQEHPFHIPRRLIFGEE